MAFLDLGRAGTVIVRVSRQGIEVEIDGRPMRGYDSAAGVAWGEVHDDAELTPSWGLAKEHIVLLRTQVPWCDSAHER